MSTEENVKKKYPALFAKDALGHGSNAKGVLGQPGGIGSSSQKPQWQPASGDTPMEGVQVAETTHGRYMLAHPDSDESVNGEGHELSYRSFNGGGRVDLGSHSSGAKAKAAALAHHNTM